MKPRPSTASPPASPRPRTCRPRCPRRATGCVRVRVPSALCSPAQPASQAHRRAELDGYAARRKGRCRRGRPGPPRLLQARPPRVERARLDADGCWRGALGLPGAGGAGHRVGGGGISTGCGRSCAPGAVPPSSRWVPQPGAERGTCSGDPGGSSRGAGAVAVGDCSPCRPSCACRRRRAHGAAPRACRGGDGVRAHRRRHAR